MTRFRLFACSIAVAAMVLFIALPAFSQTQPSPSASATTAAKAPVVTAPSVIPTATASVAKSAYGSANWTKYLAWVLAGFAVLTLGMAAMGWLIQSPGFRKLDDESE